MLPGAPAGGAAAPAPGRAAAAAAPAPRGSRARSAAWRPAAASRAAASTRAGSPRRRGRRSIRGAKPRRGCEPMVSGQRAAADGASSAAASSSLNVRLGVGNAALLQQLTPTVAGCAVERGVERDRVARHETAAVRGAASRRRPARGAAVAPSADDACLDAGRRPVGVGHVAVRADDLVRGRARHGQQCQAQRHRQTRAGAAIGARGPGIHASNLPGKHRRVSGHALMAQQRVDRGSRPRKAEAVHRRPAAADLEDRLAVAPAGGGVEHARPPRRR